MSEIAHGAVRGSRSSRRDGRTIPCRGRWRRPGEIRRPARPHPETRSQPHLRPTRPTICSTTAATVSLSRQRPGDGPARSQTIAASDAVELARQLVGIELEPSERRPGELVAFDIMVEGIGLTGRWARLSPRRGKVWWTHNVEDDTGGCGSEESRVVAALRRTVPVTPDIVRRAELVRANARGPLSTLGQTSATPTNAIHGDVRS